MTRFLVIGAAGYAQEVAWSLREQQHARGESSELRFFDDHVTPGRLPSGLGEVVGTIDDVAAHADGDTPLVLGIGRPRIKAAVVERLAGLAAGWATVIHPLAVIGPNAVIGEGSYIGAGAILTVNVTIGRFVTVNLHCQVAHEDVLADFVTLHPDVHLSGDVHLGTGVEVGTGAIAIPGVRIAEWATLGAGCVAVRSLAGGATYVGMPARALATAEMPRRIEAAR